MEFNKDWQFRLMDLPGTGKDDFEKRGWRTVNLPHDWSVEHDFCEKLEGCTGYLPGGTGCYKKTFETTDAMVDRLVHVNFDGIYNHSDIYLNGEHLVSHPNGYTPVEIEISQYLKAPGQENVLTVQVDHSRYADSRWYTGSGIYRNVMLTTTDKCYIPSDGIYITTPEITGTRAKVSLEVSLQNFKDEDQKGTLEAQIMDDDGLAVGEAGIWLEIAEGQRETYRLIVEIDTPKLWDVDCPHLYTTHFYMQTEGASQEKMVVFGIRSINFDAKTGFSINGRSEKIKGVCLHHDGGLVGAAVQKDVWRRRLATLKEGGCNAIRTAHNPASSEFLDLCDEMGFLVQEEFFDEWDYGKDKRNNMDDRHGDYISEGYAGWFQDWAKKDLETTMLRDRNHPCIIQWSIGNEIEWTYEATMKSTGYFDADASGNYFWTKPPYGPEEIQKRYEASDKDSYEMGTTAQNLSKWTKALDPARPVILNAILPSADYGNGVAQALDIIGYSYRRIMYDFCHEYFPDLPIMGTENLGQWHEWKAVSERDFISGMFIWTGIDYMGESHNQWPVTTTGSGLLDRAGFKKPSWHLFRTLWKDALHVYMTTKSLEDSIYETDGDGQIIDQTEGGWEKRLWLWHDVEDHWNYKPDEAVVVEVMSNCETVELFLNDVSCGKQELKDQADRLFKWLVPFEAGQLKAVGYENGQTVSYSIHTAGAPEEIQLTVETGSEDSGRVIQVVVQLMDAAGHPVLHRNEEVIFELEGDLEIIGVDNGSNSSTQAYKSDRIFTDKGRALVILRKIGESGGRLTAKAENLAAESALDL